MRKADGRLKSSSHPGAYHHGDLRRALIEAATHLIEEQGLAALSLREAARLTGVTHQAPYRHFADKSEIVAAVAEDGFRALNDAVAQAVARATGGPWERFDAFGVAYVEFAIARPAQFRVMFGPEVADKSKFAGLRAAADGLMAMFTQMIAEAQRANAIRTGDPLDFGLAGWSMMHGLASLLLDGRLGNYPHGTMPATDVARLMIRTLRLGMAAAPTARGQGSSGLPKKNASRRP